MNFDLFKSSEDDFMVPSNPNFSVILYYTFPLLEGGVTGIAEASVKELNAVQGNIPLLFPT